MTGEPRFSDTPVPFAGPPNTVWDALNKKRVCAEDLNKMAVELDAVWEELVTTYCLHGVDGGDACPAYENDDGLAGRPCKHAADAPDYKHGPDCLRRVRLNIEDELGL